MYLPTYLPTYRWSAPRSMDVLENRCMVRDRCCKTESILSRANLFRKQFCRIKLINQSISKINKWIGKLFWLRQNILQKCNKNGPIKSQPLFAYFLLFSSNIFTEKTADFCIIQTRIVILGKKNTDH